MRDGLSHFPAAGPRQMHRLRRLRQRLPQGGHPYAAGPGGVPVPHRHRCLHPMRPLCPYLPRSEAAGAPAGAGGVRRLEPRRLRAPGVHRRRRISPAGGVYPGRGRRGVRRGPGPGAAGAAHRRKGQGGAAPAPGGQARAKRPGRQLPPGAPLSGPGAAGAVLRAPPVRWTACITS